MKICPFVSHMLGDDNSNTWTIDSGSTEKKKSSKKPGKNVVVLGYEEGSSGGTDTMTEVATATKASKGLPSHLHCLKESCRFYKKKNGDCQFDLIFSMLEQQRDQPPVEIDWDPGTITKPLSRDIDKVWKFQTKSVAELIKGFAESEKGHTKSVTNLKKDLEKSLDILASKLEKSGSADIKKNITDLRKQLEEREQGFEDLSGTMSELVLNLHESITKIEDRSADTLKQIEKISDTVPDESVIQTLIERSMDDQLSKIEPTDVSGPIGSLRGQIEDLATQQQSANSDYEEKLETALKAQSKTESKTAAWHEEIADRIQDLRTQQKIWEEKFKKLADYQIEIIERLDNAQTQKENGKDRSGKKDAKKFNNLGVTSFHNGAYDMACEQFLQAVKLDPDFSEAYNNLGLACTEMGRDEQASEAFECAIELNPELHAAYNNLGYIYFKKGDYDQAIEMYNEALGRSSDNGSAYTNLGNAYFKLDRVEDAKQAWSKALEIDPGNEKAKRNLDRIGEGA